MEECEPQSRLDGRRPEVTLDPIEDRRQPDELAVRVQLEDRPDEGLTALGNGKPLAQPAANRRPADLAPGSPDVGFVGLGRSELTPALLVATDRAAVLLLQERPVGRPRELVDGHVPAAGRTARREQLPD